MTAPAFSILFPAMLAAAEAGQMGVRSYVTFEAASVYLRVTRRFIKGKVTLCVDIANIEVPKDEQKRGTFTRLVQAIRSHTNLPIHVENVLTKRFATGLERRGFVSLDRSNPTPGYMLFGAMTEPAETS